jgi:hypothetical protein
MSPTGTVERKKSASHLPAFNSTNHAQHSGGSVHYFLQVYIPNFLFINLFTPRNAPDKANRASRLVQHRRRFAL